MLARDREESVLWARDLLDRCDWVILDTETTGLGNDAEIISITVMAPTGEILVDTLLKPSDSIPQDATAVNGITDQMVANAPMFTEVVPKIRQVLAGRQIIAYNAEFDERMLMATCYRYKVSYKEMIVKNDPPGSYSTPWRCAMLRYAAYFGEWNDYWGSYRWQKLPKGDHTAKGDCQATLELIRRMAE